MDTKKEQEQIKCNMTFVQYEPRYNEWEAVRSSPWTRSCQCYIGQEKSTSGHVSKTIRIWHLQKGKLVAAKENLSLSS